MSSEEVFRPGMRVESAIQEFRDRVSRRETIASWKRREIRKLLLRVQPLLADPITADQSQALDDAFHGRHRIEDLLEWLQSPTMAWDQFPAFQQEQANLRREQLWQAWKTLEELRGDKPELCPSCGSRSVVRIVYGLPNEVGQEAARRGAITLGGCIVVEDAPKWQCGDCGHEWGKLFGIRN
jgi:hypothetical protein